MATTTAHVARVAAQLREAARDVARVAELRRRCAELPQTAEQRASLTQPGLPRSADPRVIDEVSAPHTEPA